MRQLIVAIVLLLPAAELRAESFTIDQSKSTISFSVRHLLGNARGTYHRFKGTMNIDREHPELSSINVAIEVSSIDTGIRKRDEHLLGSEFFDAARYPEIKFRSRGAKRMSAETGDIPGELAIKGVTRPFTLHVRLLTHLDGTQLPDRMRWQVTCDPIRRKDFALMFGSTAEAISGIGQEVIPACEIELVREP